MTPKRDPLLPKPLNTLGLVKKLAKTTSLISLLKKIKLTKKI